MSVPAQSLWNGAPEKAASGVSWSAVIAGAAAAAALALILLVLGAGLGMSTVSPWPGRGMSVSGFGASSIAWLVLTQIIASAAGGYLAGRLRIKWTAIHTDEVYFRDTAHGFLAWAVAALVSACLVGGLVAPILSAGAGVTAAATAVSTIGVESGQSDRAPGRAGHDNDHGFAQGDSARYLVQSLFRPGPAAPDGQQNTDAASLLEATSIFTNSIHASSLPAPDQQYLAQMVSKRTGLSEADATKRVNDTFAAAHEFTVNAENSAREVADKARKATAYAALWMFISLLCGAFCASLAATYGGRQRDHMAHAA
ncbi:MAG: hypothetical protein JO002_13000 [Burkholderiaceae bacterium]|nr:hypothetical protein [Burkholderiaceae bacterium]